MEFRISKIKMCLGLLAGMIALWGGYMLIISKVLIGQIFGLAVSLISCYCVTSIIYKLFKPINSVPIMIIDAIGIYHKDISSVPIPWDNVRLIWKSSMTIPRRLYIETMDHPPSKYPHNILFSILTPGFSAAWDYLNKNYPDKIRGNTDATSKISF